MENIKKLIKINKKIYIPIKSCPLCGSSNSKIIRSEKNNFPKKNKKQREFFVIYEKDKVYLKLCRNCDFAYVDRLPKDPSFFYNYYNVAKWDYPVEFKYHGKKDMIKDAKFQIKKFCPKGSLLDIGTLCGAFLNFMSDTYTSTGCELKEGAVAYGRSIGLNIHKGSFDSIKFKKSFDIITLIDVLEHLPNPKKVLSKIFKLLNSKGILYIKVPNGKLQVIKQNLLQALRLSNKGVFQNFCHINHFNHASLSKVLKSIGFEIIEEGYAKAELHNLNLPAPLFKKLKKLLHNSAKKSIFETLNFISNILSVDVGMHIYVIARKPDKYLSKKL